MPKFDIRVGQTLSAYQVAFIEVEADTAEEASEQIKARIDAGESDHWDFDTRDSWYTEGGQAQVEDARLIQE